MSLWLALFAPALGADFLQVDAGAPGMAVQVNVLRESGGFTGTETVTTDCADVVVGPVFVLDRGANPSAPLGGSTLSTVFFIDPAASTGDCVVSIDGIALGALSSGIDNLFSIVTPRPAPVDGGSGDLDGTADGVLTVAAADRSDGGTVVFDSLTVAATEILRFDTSDPLSVSPGNEAFLPVIVLVEGAAAIAGTLDVSGGDAPAASYYAGDGGDGGVGGGGGGVGSNCVYANRAEAGDGFTGGGGATAGTCIDFVAGGVGSLEDADGEDGGEGLFTSIANGALGYAGGTGGGTGMAWGTGGGGGYCCGTSGAGGYGGGGGPGHSEAGGWGAGRGGFGTDGESGVGVVGGAAAGYTTGGAGRQNGDATLVPLAGGSGGGGGDSGSGVADGGGGGGGGGALMLVAASLQIDSTAFFDLSGGDGGNTNGVNPGSSTAGGGGAGGGLHLASQSLAGLSAFVLDLSGGLGGVEGSARYYSGDGGEGRLRVDGVSVPTPGLGPTAARASTWEGPAITAVTADTVTVRGSGSLQLYVCDGAGAVVATLSPGSGDTVDLTGSLLVGDNYLVLAADGVIGPASAAFLTFDPDVDGDGYTYFGGDCDDSDASVSPAATELCDSIDNNCDGLTDDPTSADASTWYTDSDADGYGEDATAEPACAPPTDAVAIGGDCDDHDDDVSPGAPEVCNGIDDDCDGLIDGSSDGDTWYADADGDGFGDPGLSVTQCDPPEGYVADAGDCDDADATVNPDASEQCDGVDNDCDGATDDSGATDATSWFYDDDGDGYGDPTVTFFGCSAPAGYGADNTDCDDTDADVNPTAAEVCDSADNNCDGTVDENASAEVCDGVDNDCDGDIDEDADGATVWYADLDEDGYGDADATLLACGPEGYVSVAGDCDDAAADVNPTAAEVCDSADNNCDGTVDENASAEVCDGVDNNCDGAIDEDAEGASVWYADLDGDGYGDANTTLLACGPEGYVSVAGDCDDTDADLRPDAVEQCDGVDQDCDGLVDEEATDLSSWYTDGDGDGYGDSAVDAVLACDAPPGTVSGGGDCDDADPAYNPGATEADCADPNDYNCDGSVGWADTDGDGYAACEECDDGAAAVYPGATEQCDGIDNDCDGTVDVGATDASTWYDDGDRDGWGDETAVTLACDAPDGHVDLPGDCDDTDSDFNPGAEELDCADPNDYNCDGSTGYADADDDGHVACEECDDSNETIHPGAAEVCNDVDDDCDGEIDEDGEGGTFYADADGDGYGNAAATRSACDAPEGYVEDATDCDDGAADAFPGGVEVWYDGVDQDCDGNDADQDGDGFLAKEVGGGDCDDLDAAIGDGCDDGVVLPDDKYAGGGGCGCETGASGAVWGALLGIGAMVRRRRRS